MCYPLGRKSITANCSSGCLRTAKMFLYCRIKVNPRNPFIYTAKYYCWSYVYKS